MVLKGARRPVYGRISSSDGFWTVEALAVRERIWHPRADATRAALARLPVTLCNRGDPMGLRLDTVVTASPVLTTLTAPITNCRTDEEP
jgi:hypothetical protein